VKGKDNASETLAKGLRILDIFGVEDAGFTLSQISGRVSLNKTSVYRYVNTFRELGYLRRDERTGLYHLGVRSLSLAHAIMEKSEMVQQVKPFVDDAFRKHGVHVDVGILSGDAIYLIYRHESKDTSVFRSFSYSSEPYYLATGKAAMAFMEPAELDALIDRLDLAPKTDKTITDKDALREELKRSNEQGYSMNNEEFVPGLIAIGAPLFSLRTGKVVGGVSFDSTTDQYSMKDFEERFRGYLVELSKKISAVVSL
jgi:IclR family pca regulon transcriptional regulator